ncbi:hypothetical protein K3495_g6519 [Podosphaera aphanis]|nr:hypothetical protein K3495_g6519 [Podosphaera aphanis]
MNRKTKIIWQLNSPFTNPEWPEVSPEHQGTILELLCSLLYPLGQHRLNHVTRSKGKRSKKRKRKAELEHKAEVTNEKALVPSPPQISSFVVTGLNSVLRSLESLACLAREKMVAQKSPSLEVDQANVSEITDSPTQHFSVIFVLNSSQPTIFLDHLLQLVATASLAHPELPKTRLLQLPRDSGARLCESIGLARVSVIGVLEGAPLSTGLLEFVREHVAEVKNPWLLEARKGSYLPVTIKAVKTLAPAAEKKQKDK